MEGAPIVDDGKARTDVWLFNRWSYDDVKVPDLSVEDNITATDSKHPKFMPHSAGRYQARRFSKEIQLESTKLERITCYRRRPELSNRFTRSVLR